MNSTKIFSNIKFGRIKLFELTQHTTTMRFQYMLYTEIKLLKKSRIMHVSNISLPNIHNNKLVYEVVCQSGKELNVRNCT